MARIKALDSEVVHKIAAGEIIVRPSNAIKELIENSIDAKSTRIDVLVKEGGLKMLQITDNGHGIDADDFPILCHRFTTSKLQEVEDLQTIGTLGFRGEALASISHVSHLTVKTKTHNSKTATQADFLAGEMIGDSQRRLAGIDGTQITVNDLFYNTRHRLEAFDKRKSRTEEYHRILETVQKYAILYSHVNFTVKRAEDTQPVIVSGKSVKERIRSIYELGQQDLLEVKLAQPATEDKRLGLLGVSGYATGLNLTKRKPDTLVLFINNRLVSWGKLSSAIRNLYTEIMPLNSAHYFVFLSLTIEPQNVDVNIHPTKREVKVLFEDEINERIIHLLKDVLVKTEGSRNYKVQSYIASTTLPSSDISSPHTAQLSIRRSVDSHSASGSTLLSTSRGVEANRYEYNLVRTDPKQQTLTPYIQSTTSKISVRSTPQSSPVKGSRYLRRHDFEENNEEEYSIKSETEIESDNENGFEKQSDKTIELEDVRRSGECCGGHDSKHSATFEDREDSDLDTAVTAPQTPQKLQRRSSPGDEPRCSSRYNPPIQSFKSEREFSNANLVSVESLIATVKSQASPELLKLIAEHTFVGIVDTKRGLAAVQWDVRLYLIDYMEMCFEMFYQIGLTQFANFGTIYLGDGLSVRSLFDLNKKVSGDNISSAADYETTFDETLLQVTAMAEMLEEYFQIKLKYRNEEWVLTQLPLLLPDYVPPASRLPHFIADLFKVDWEQEKECIDGVTRALAALYVPSNTVTRSQMMLIFDRAKFGFVPTKSLRSCVTEIANLPGLYRVFERC